VSLFLPDRHTATIRGWIARVSPQLAVSTFATAEFASAISIAVRTQRLQPSDATRVMRVFDGWVETDTEIVDLEAADHRLAAAFVRRFELALRAPDALHIAVCRRLSVPLATFDLRQEMAARALGVACEAMA